ncbi:phospholipase D family protein [Alkanindiges illinoisensis]|uniref:phospholipase D family protein n=1 Tax=Alkanindiges illinoisensis TaxID=197183 RepID=UPI00047C9CD4|nr:phospholipase D family protein [Alkanindiges illinoisensis]
MRFFQYLLNQLNWTKKTMLMFLLGLWCLAYLASAIYQVYKPLPQGLNVALPLRTAGQVQFLGDYTYTDQQNQRHQQQEIFDQAFDMISQARRMIVVDMFLFNDYVGDSKAKYRNLTAELTQALIAKHKSQSDIQIVVITDPINTVYGGQFTRNLLDLRQAGVEVIETDLKPLRASNPLWSGFWYLCCQWFDNNPQAGWLPNPLGADKITLRSYFTLFNFKANHRKTLITDAPDGWQALVTSANPHNASSWHDNTALKFSGAAALDVLETERAVARMSGADLPFIVTAVPPPASDDQPRLQILTEAKIRDALLNSLNTAQSGDRLDIAVFYLSHRKIIAAIKDAKQRGVNVRLLLDPNEDAFGRKKNGIPNRQVAMELKQAGVPLRWCSTHGEQCHTKMLVKTSAKNGQAELILGSANFTRRNLNNLNLETDVRLLANADYPAITQAHAYFDRVWTNQNGQNLSVAYEKYKDESQLKYWWYRFTEWSGLSTF